MRDLGEDGYYVYIDWKIKFIVIDCYVFSSETCVWSLVEAEGTCPSPRDKLASGVIGKKMFIFGGFGPKSTDGVDVRNMAVYVIKPT